MVTGIIQTPQMVSRISNFYQVGLGQALDCSSSSDGVALVALPANQPYANDVLLYNDGGEDGDVVIYVAFGTTLPIAAVPADGAPANGVIVAPGAYLTFNKGTAGYVAGIAPDGDATLYIYQGYGS